MFVSVEMTELGWARPVASGGGSPGGLSVRRCRAAGSRRQLAGPRPQRRLEPARERRTEQHRPALRDEPGRRAARASIEPSRTPRSTTTPTGRPELALPGLGVDQRLVGEDEVEDRSEPDHLAQQAVEGVDAAPVGDGRPLRGPLEAFPALLVDRGQQRGPVREVAVHSRAPHARRGRDRPQARPGAAGPRRDRRVDDVAAGAGRAGRRRRWTLAHPCSVRGTSLAQNGTSVFH